jgi:hypothetical protein
MRRREFMSGLGSAAAWPLATRAQQSALPMVGFLIRQSADEVHKNMTAPFLQGLKEAGYVEGQNVAVEYRYAENQFDRLPALATDLVRHRVAVILAGGIDASLAAKAATSTIPIVFISQGANSRRVTSHSNSILNDAQIASLKRRLNLTAEQERMWPAVESALRKIVYTRTAMSQQPHGARSKAHIQLRLQPPGHPRVLRISRLTNVSESGPRLFNDYPV